MLELSDQLIDLELAEFAEAPQDGAFLDRMQRETTSEEAKKLGLLDLKAVRREAEGGRKVVGHFPLNLPFRSGDPRAATTFAGKCGDGCTPHPRPAL